jgi:C4-dicarboxylate transporter DctM subunit
MVWVGICILIVTLFLEVPMFISILLSALIILVAGMHFNPIMAPTIMFSQISSVLLIAVPMFMVSGVILARSGAVPRLVTLLNAFMGHMPGGPALALIAVTVIFGAMCSSSIAALAGLAPVMLPLLTQLGYSKRFAIGLLITSATIVPMVPPSVSMIIFAWLTGINVIWLWTAGIVPALLVSVFLGLTVLWHVKRGAYVRPPKVSWKERRDALKKGFWVVLMPFAILGPLYGGVATPTEVSTIAVVYSLFLGFVVYRELTLSALLECCRSTLKIIGSLFAIMMAAYLLNTALVYARIPFGFSAFLANMGLGRGGFMTVMIGVYLAMGAALDPTAILLISVPLLWPTITGLDINPYVYGIFTAHAIEIGIITPPYGFVLFAAVSIFNERFTAVVRSCMMFYPAVIAAMIMIAYIPELSLWLPRVLGQGV